MNKIFIQARLWSMPAVSLLFFNLLCLTGNAQGKRFQVDHNGTLTTGLDAYYKLEDPTDFWGTNNLTNYNSTPFDSGKVNNAVDFNGSNQYLFKVNPVSTSTTAVSAAGWVYISNALQKGAFVKNGRTDTNPLSNGWGIGVGNITFNDAGNNLVVVASAINWMQSANPLGLGWHHVAVTYTYNGSTSTWKLYVDTVLNGTYNYGMNPPDSLFQMSKAVENGGVADFFQGKLDEWGIWDKELSQSEIDDLYNGGAGQTMTNGPFTTATVNWNNGNVQEITLSSNRTFAFADGNSGGAYTLLVKQDATGGWYTNWPGNVKWADGVAPSLTLTPNAVDLIKFVYDGTNYLGNGITLNLK